MISLSSRSLAFLAGGVLMLAAAGVGAESAAKSAVRVAAAPVVKPSTAHGVVKSVGDRRLAVESKEWAPSSSSSSTRRRW